MSVGFAEMFSSIEGIRTCAIVIICFDFIVFMILLCRICPRRNGVRSENK